MTSTFGEVAAEPQVASLPLAHVSVELGHLYMDAFAAGPEGLLRHFDEVGPWAQALERWYSSQLKGRTARISTCFLVDDYFTRFSTPAKVIPDLLTAADESGLRIDYLARESACAQADRVPLAELMVGRLVPEPPPGTNGSRPPVHEVGWLCNGERSATGEVDEAMGSAPPWRPARQNSAYDHSIFIDVELWSEGKDGKRIWSCACLAAVWQLLRLGLLRDEGKPVAQPRPLAADGLPESWDELPPILQLNPTAHPFSAYRTFSVLTSQFFPVEHAVRTVLSQVSIPPPVMVQVRERSAAEHMPVPPEVVDRISYVFMAGF